VNFHPYFFAPPLQVGPEGKKRNGIGSGSPKMYSESRKKCSNGIIQEYAIASGSCSMENEELVSSTPLISRL